MRKQRVYAIISSYRAYEVGSHEVEFSSLREAKKTLEEHIAAMTKVGDYEIFKDEAAHNVQPRENDMSITLYVSSGDDEDYGNEVEADYVIIRPKKGEAD